MKLQKEIKKDQERRSTRRKTKRFLGVNVGLFWVVTKRTGKVAKTANRESSKIGEFAKGFVDKINT